MTRPSTSARLRRTAVAALIPLSFAALTACGDDEGDSTAGDPVATQQTDGDEEPTTDTDTDAEPAGDFEAPEEPGPVEPKALYAAMYDGFEQGGTAQVTTENETLGMTISGEGVVDYSGDEPETAMTMADFMGSGQTADVRLVDGIVYLNLGTLTNDKFVTVDPTDKNNPLGATMADSYDPRAALEMFGDAITGAEYLGEEDVADGTSDHYEMTIDGTKLFGELAGAMGAGGAEVRKMLPKEIEVDVWLGAEDGYVRQLDTAMGQLGTSSMTFTEWGDPVEIEAPPADQVSDQDLFGGMGGAMGGPSTQAG